MLTNLTAIISLFIQAYSKQTRTGPIHGSQQLKIKYISSAKMGNCASCCNEKTIIKGKRGARIQIQGDLNDPSNIAAVMRHQRSDVVAGDRYLSHFGLDTLSRSLAGDPEALPSSIANGGNLEQRRKDGRRFVPNTLLCWRPQAEHDNFHPLQIVPMVMKKQQAQDLKTQPLHDMNQSHHTTVPGGPVGAVLAYTAGSTTEFQMGGPQRAFSSSTGLKHFFRFRPTGQFTPDMWGGMIYGGWFPRVEIEVRDGDKTMILVHGQPENNGDVVVRLMTEADYDSFCALDEKNKAKEREIARLEQLEAQRQYDLALWERQNGPSFGTSQEMHQPLNPPSGHNSQPPQVRPSTKPISIPAMPPPLPKISGHWILRCPSSHRGGREDFRIIPFLCPQSALTLSELTTNVISSAVDDPGTVDEPATASAVARLKGNQPVQMLSLSLSPLAYPAGGKDAVMAHQTFALIRNSIPDTKYSSDNNVYKDDTMQLVAWERCPEHHSLVKILLDGADGRSLVLGTQGPGAPLVWSAAVQSGLLFRAHRTAIPGCVAFELADSSGYMFNIPSQWLFASLSSASLPSAPVATASMKGIEVKPSLTAPRRQAMVPSQGGADDAIWYVSRDGFTNAKKMLVNQKFSQCALGAVSGLQAKDPPVPKNAQPPPNAKDLDSRADFSSLKRDNSFCPPAAGGSTGVDPDELGLDDSPTVYGNHPNTAEEYKAAMLKYKEDMKAHEAQMMQYQVKVDQAALKMAEWDKMVDLANQVSKANAYRTAYDDDCSARRQRAAMGTTSAQLIPISGEPTENIGSLRIRFEIVNARPQYGGLQGILKPGLLPLPVYGAGAATVNLVAENAPAGFPELSVFGAWGCPRDEGNYFLVDYAGAKAHKKGLPSLLTCVDHRGPQLQGPLELGLQLRRHESYRQPEMPIEQNDDRYRGGGQAQHRDMKTAMTVGAQRWALRPVNFGDNVPRVVAELTFAPSYFVAHRSESSNQRHHHHGSSGPFALRPTALSNLVVDATGDPILFQIRYVV